VLVADADRRVPALRSWLVSLLVLCLAAVSVITSTAVPDQTWFPGIYDLVDDDVVALLADTTADGPRALRLIDPARIAVGSPPPPLAVAPADASVARVLLRSPPAV